MVDTEKIIYWLDKYEKKMEQHFFEAWDINFYPCLYLFDDGSMFTYTVVEDKLEVGPASLNIKNSWNTICQIARSMGLSKVATITPHNPKAYARLTKSTLTEVKVIDGTPHYYMVKEI